MTSLILVVMMIMSGGDGDGCYLIECLLYIRHRPKHVTNIMSLIHLYDLIQSFHNLKAETIPISILLVSKSVQRVKIKQSKEDFFLVRRQTRAAQKLCSEI